MRNVVLQSLVWPDQRCINALPADGLLLRQHGLLMRTYTW